MNEKSARLVEKIVKQLGGLRAAARAGGVAHQNVQMWLKGYRVPQEVAARWEVHLERPGLAKRLRPDVDWELLTKVRVRP